MIKINFRGEEINKLKAKSLISKLGSGLISPNLNEQEQKVYKSLKKAIKYFNSLSEKQNLKNFEEKEYLIGTLKSRIKLAELEEKIKYCQENGHKEGSSSITSGQSRTQVYAHCTHCGMAYQRNLSTKEWIGFDKMMNTPMTI